MTYFPIQPDTISAGNSSTTPLVTLMITGASWSSPNLILTGAWGTGGSNAYVGSNFSVSGFTGLSIGNNGFFMCTASSAGSITLTDTSGYNGLAGTPIAAQAFTGTAVDLTTIPVSKIVVQAYSDQNSATNGIQLQYSEDNVNWNRSITSTYSVSHGQADNITSGVLGRYFRLIYINGVTSQTVFYLQTLLSILSSVPASRDLNQDIESNDTAVTTRAILAGLTTNTTPGYINVAADTYGSLHIIPGPSAEDAFGRLKVAEPVSLFNSQFQYDNQPLLFQTSLIGTGSVAKTANESSITLSTGGTVTGATAINQTKRYFRYQPGKSQHIVMTGILGAQKLNVQSKIGYYDANDGVFFQMDGTVGASVNQRSSVGGSVNTTSVVQANWNIDKMDGTGPSGIVIDFSKTQIFDIDMQWLGTGRVRFGFIVNGMLYLAHQFFNTNVIMVPYTNTANLPIRAEITNTGTAASTTSMKQICMAVISSGGSNTPAVYQFSANNGSSVVTTNGTPSRTPILSIRPATTFNGITNRTNINILDINLYSNANNNIFWELVYNGTLSGGGPTWTAANTNSGVQYNTDSTACANGIVVASGYVAGGGKVLNTQLNVSAVQTVYPFTLDFTGTVSDVYSFCATGFSSTTCQVAASISWTEDR